MERSGRSFPPRIVWLLGLWYLTHVPRAAGRISLFRPRTRTSATGLFLSSIETRSAETVSRSSRHPLFTA